MVDQKSVGFNSLNGTLKVILTLLLIVGLIVPVVLGCVNFDSRLDDAELEIKESTIELSDDIENCYSKIGANKDLIHMIELQQKETTTQYVEILRRLGEMQGELKTWEPQK